MSFYVGSDSRGWCIISEQQLFAFDRNESKFISIEGQEEVLRHFEEDGRYDIYAWDNGIWRKVDFVAVKSKSTDGPGFAAGKQNLDATDSDGKK